MPQEAWVVIAAIGGNLNLTLAESFTEIEFYLLVIQNLECRLKNLVD